MEQLSATPLATGASAGQQAKQAEPGSAHG